MEIKKTIDLLNKYHNSNNRLMFIILILSLCLVCCSLYAICLTIQYGNLNSEYNKCKIDHKQELLLKDKKIILKNKSIKSLEKENEILSDIRPVHGVVSDY